MASPLSTDLAQQALDLLAEHDGNQAKAAAAAGVSRSTFQNRIAAGKLKGLRPNVTIPETANEMSDELMPFATLLKKKPMTLDEVAAATGLSRGQALDALEAIERTGVSISKIGDRYTLQAHTHPAFMRADSLPTFTSDKDGNFLFGAVSDNHIGSKYSRLDVLNTLYDRFVQEGVGRVYNAGNWIDGEASFNVHDLVAHGMDEQLRHLARDYPQRHGIETFAVAGDDHEGWYAQKFGVDIGARAEQTMRSSSRSDWHNLGYMEAHIRLIHGGTGAEAVMAVVHPGGGSSYAVSYSIQKIIESLDGGEKPAVGLYGHYHKLWAGNVRNVWTVQTGCTEDQTPFMRKKKLEAHVGGVLIRMKQDPESGAITEFSPTMMRFFNKGFYNNRWSHSDGVVLPKRGR